MTALSIMLPHNIAKASQHAAQKLGVSRSEFIRQAIVHELESLDKRLEREAIIESFAALKKDKKYLKETEELDHGFSSSLPKDGDEWWKK